MILPDAIMWDLDGTIIDSAPDLAGALSTLLQKHGKVPLEVTDVRRMIGDGVAMLVERGFKAAGQTLDDEGLASLVPQFLSIYSSRATRLTQTYPGARQVLWELQKRGVKQAICTNKPEQVSRAILDALDLGDIFECVVGGNTTAHKKPHTCPMQFCLDSLGTNAGNTLMIGDSGVDVAAARAMRMTVGIVTHGYAREPVATLGADFLIPDLERLPAQLHRRVQEKVVAP